MKRILLDYNFLLVILFNLSVVITSAQVDVANYKMDIYLHDETKQIDGYTELSWTNTSKVPVTELQFHLYYNAFRNNKSTFFSENNNRMSFLDPTSEERWSWSEIKMFKDQDGNALQMSYIQPDDQNPIDKTVLKIQLENPVLPSETQVFNFEWHAKIPKIMPRTGYNKDYIFMAQWFPKIGVFEPKGLRGNETAGWNCHQYHSSGEYYANFGDYEVSVNLPSQYIFGSSGLLIDKVENDDRIIWKTKVEQVIDFTWTASPHYLELKDKWQNVDLILLCYPEHAHYDKLYFNAIQNAMSFLDKHVGQYPYPKLTIVDVPLHGLFTGGMEYPLLISSFGVDFLPKGVRVTEILAIHEFVHQYFMQMVATNETEDPWMDEGITTYYECRIVDEYYGKNRSAIDFMGVQAGGFEYNRYELLNARHEAIAPGNYASWEYPANSYGNVAYNKMASVLKTLENEIGTEHFDNCMKIYFDTWKFRHPGPNDFIEIFNNYAKSNLSDKYPNGLNWFFDQTIFEDSYCDYEVVGIQSFSPVPEIGVFDIDQNAITNSDFKSDHFISKIDLRKNGTIKIPVDLYLCFEDGSSKSMTWHPQLDNEQITIKSASPLISAEIDPLFKIDLDTNVLNNGKRVKSKSVNANKYSKKMQMFLQLFLEFASSLF